MVQVILVRHGETDWNHIRRVQGSGSDIHLNDTGAGQAAKLARRLSREKVTAIYSSPLQRARSTALAIAGGFGLVPQVERDLREIDAGRLEGQTLETLGRRLDELLVMTAEEMARAGIAPYDGETLELLQRRAWPAIQRIVGVNPEGTVLVVTHYFVILTVICAVLGLPLSRVVQLRMSVGSISRLVFEDTTPRLALFNDTCHLE